MNFFSIDCSTDIGSLFVKIKSKTFVKILQSHKFSNDLLMKQILDFFSRNNIEFGDISQIFINQGPGSFSGLRGSLAVAKGISLSKNLSLFGYDTFIWSTTKFIHNENSIYSIFKFREKYFIKKFSKNYQVISKAEEVQEDEIIKNYQKKFKIIPKNLVKYFDKKILELDNLNIVDLDHNQLEFLKLKGLLNKDLIKPIYLS